MQSNLKPGDFLAFQLEAGFAVLRLLAIDEDSTWHVAAYEDFYLDIDSAEAAIAADRLRVSLPHVALTARAFESTQTARIANQPLTPDDLIPLEAWRQHVEPKVSDRSIRLMLGLR